MRGDLHIIPYDTSTVGKREEPGKFAERRMIPLVPAFSCTVHKLQGQNCDYAYDVDLCGLLKFRGSRHWAMRALLYVAISHATKAEYVQLVFGDVLEKYRSRRRPKNITVEDWKKDTLLEILNLGHEERKRFLEVMRTRNLIAK